MKKHIDAETISCGLIAHPSKHSLSPLLQNTLSSELGVNMVYTAHDVEPYKGKAAYLPLKNAVKGAEALGYRGLNITVPYKTEVINYAKELDELAGRAGAVNTLVRRKGKKGYKGYNTDISGLKRALAADGIDVKGKNAIVIGAGGAARAVCTMLAMNSASSVTVLNRTLFKGEELVDTVRNSCNYSNIAAFGLNEYGSALDAEKKYICFQTTTVGMYPDNFSSPIDDGGFFDMLEAAVDIVYNPMKTRFMSIAENRGVRTVGGLKMLLYQGIDAFELWFDMRVPENIASKAYTALEAALNNKKTVILIGFMGSGKTSVAEILSDRLDEVFIDMDKSIEAAENRSVSDIISDDGESSFRDIETALLKKISKESGLPFILSCGGGVPLRTENRAVLNSLGTVVYLKTSAEEIYRRIKDDKTRPLIQTGDPYKTVVSMQEAREEFYNMAADFIVNTDGLTAVETADIVIKKIFGGGDKSR